MKKARILLAGVLFFCSGCAGSSYIRSDVFLNVDSVKHLYIMPIATEVKIDSKFEITKEQLREGINDSLTAALKTFHDEFYKRGYEVEFYPKPFAHLDKNDANENCIRKAIFQFMKPQTTTSLFSVQSKKQSDQSKFYEVGVKNFSPEDYDPLVTKTLACSTAFSSASDTVIYSSLKSNIAARALFGGLKEDSVLELNLKIIDLTSKEIIYSYGKSFSESDVLSKKKVIQAIKDFLKEVPVRLMN